MGGNAKRNLRMFRELCGESALKNVCIATTNWSRVTQDEGDMRERELRESPNLFKPLIDAGVQLFRWHDKESAQSIVNYLIRKGQTKLQIQAELDEGKTLEETAAGSVLKEEMTTLVEKHKIEMQALQEEIEAATKAKQAELLAELEKERLKTEQQMLKIQEDLNTLKQQQTGVEAGFGANVLAELEDEEQMQKIQDDLDMQQTGVETGFDTNANLVPISHGFWRRFCVEVTKVVQLWRRGLIYALADEITDVFFGLLVVLLCVEIARNIFSADAGITHVLFVVLVVLTSALLYLSFTELP